MRVTLPMLTLALAVLAGAPILGGPRPSVLLDALPTPTAEAPHVITICPPGSASGCVTVPYTVDTPTPQETPTPRAGAPEGTPTPHAPVIQGPTMRGGWLLAGPSEVGPCSLIRHLCSFDPADGVTPLNVVTYLCPWGEVDVVLPWACQGDPL